MFSHILVPNLPSPPSLKTRMDIKELKRNMLYRRHKQKIEFGILAMDDKMSRKAYNFISYINKCICAFALANVMICFKRYN